MKAALFLSALASTAVGVVAEELKIDVTLPVICERKTQKGDGVHMHYRGTLKDSGKQFDASKSLHTPCICKRACSIRKSYANWDTRLRSRYSPFLQGRCWPGYQGVCSILITMHSDPMLTIETGGTRVFLTCALVRSGTSRIDILTARISHC